MRCLTWEEAGLEIQLSFVGDCLAGGPHLSSGGIVLRGPTGVIDWLKWEKIFYLYIYEALRGLCGIGGTGGNILFDEGVNIFQVEFEKRE